MRRDSSCETLRRWLASQEVPPYNFHGSLDDSLQNLRKVVPVPPRRDYVKYMDNIGKLLRYEAQLVTATFHYTSWFEAGSKHVRSWFVPNSITLAGSEPAPNQLA